VSNWHTVGARRASLRGQRLSDREVEILTAVSMGYTDGQAAAMLGITPGTVRDHVSAIKAKLGASNSAHMVRLGFVDGYLRLTTDTINRKPIGRVA
jgi:DNA-binding CsgD family transcriptional regulator